MNKDVNVNNDFYKDLDTNFNQALILCEKEFNHEDLILMLKNGNIPEKQIAALKFDYVESKKDAAALLNNLVGCDGKIREAISQTIYKILCKNTDAKKYFSQISSKILAKAAIDINGNICRNAIEIASILKYDKDFSIKYTEQIIKYIYDSFSEIDKFVYRDKKYVINKQIFKLYWCLEAINKFWEFIPIKKLEEILTKSSEQSEYTIREKAAQIIKTSGKFPIIKEKLLNDENYYVRAVFSNP